jgi:hypothetical protein
MGTTTFPVIKSGKTIMKKHILAALAGTLLLAGAAIAAADTLVLTPDETTEVQQYITTQQVTPVEPPSGFEVSVGATLPDTIELHALNVPKIQKKYEYVVIGKQTVLVEPQTRKIVQVIE